MTTNTTLHAGHDVRYLTSGNAHGGNAGAMRYYTASGEPPGRWAGTGAAALGLSGTVDAKVMDRLYMEHIGPGGERLTRPRGKAKDDDQAEAAFRAGHPFASETEVSEAVVRARAGVRVTRAVLRPDRLRGQEHLGAACLAEDRGAGGVRPG